MKQITGKNPRIYLHKFQCPTCGKRHKFKSHQILRIRQLDDNDKLRTFRFLKVIKHKIECCGVMWTTHGNYAHTRDQRITEQVPTPKYTKEAKI
jgi:hypothetical protein